MTPLSLPGLKLLMVTAENLLVIYMVIDVVLVCRWN